MLRHFTQLVFFIGIMFLLGCNKNGNSKSHKQLKLVVSHYTKNPADSLQLKAAQFLAENINYQGFFSKKQVFSAAQHQAFLYLDSVNKLIATPDSVIPTKVFKNAFKADSTFYKNDILAIPENTSELFNTDCQQLNAKELIELIDIWHKANKLETYKNWIAENEYIKATLPYRAFNEAILNTSWHKQHNASLFAKLHKEATLQDRVHYLNNYIRGFKHSDVYLDTINSRSPYGIIYGWFNDCPLQASHTANILRANGIPSFVEFTPQWKDRIGSSRHFWCSAMDENGEYHGFSPIYEVPNEHTANKTLKNATKVYRIEYAINSKAPSFLKNKNESLPFMLSMPNIVDVTENYFSVKNISINIDSIPSKKKLCYLATFNAPKWQAVGYGIINKSAKNAYFEKIPTEVVFGIVTLEDDGSTKLIRAPFFLNKNGKIIEVTKNRSITQNMRLFRKYPTTERIEKFQRKAIGTKLQLSNNPNFNGAITVHTFDSLPLPIIYNIPIRSTQKYRYARAVAKKRNLGLNIAIFEANTHSDSFNKNSILPSILSPISHDSLQILKILKRAPYQLYNSFGAHISTPMKKERQKACDGNMETYSLAGDIALDFGKPIPIYNLYYAPRNANNWIEPKDHYVLYYLKNKKWHKHSQQIAEYSYLDFDKVPSNTLYWLRNISKGKEEHPFLYHNGKQYFVNKDKITNLF